MDGLLQFGQVGRKSTSSVQQRSAFLWQVFLMGAEAKLCSRTCVRKATYEKHGDEYRKARMERYHAEKKASAGKK